MQPTLVKASAVWQKIAEFAIDEFMNSDNEWQGEQDDLIGNYFCDQNNQQLDIKEFLEIQSDEKLATLVDQCRYRRCIDCKCNFKESVQINSE